MLTIEVIDDLTTSPHREGIWALICKIDGEFVPPLSARNSPTDVSLDGSSGSGESAPDRPAGPVSYFNELLAQRSIIALEDGRLAGYLSYRSDYTVPEVSARTNAYVSTVGVDPAARGHGVSRHLYLALFDRMSREADIQAYPVMTRTWSTNASHIAIITGFGFELVGRVEDGRGKGIDTVLFALTRQRLLAQEG